MNQLKQRPKLFALLVAIDDYQPPVTPLHGCVNDLNKFYSYLQKEEEAFEVSVMKLINQEATKEAVVNAFKQHLFQAGKGDSVLFYYSGHGTQEEADPVFWKSDPDKKLEALVCYDSVIKENHGARIHLLADKELRFLIKELSTTNPHIITVFDCCHSGSNTRNGIFSSGDKKVLERRVINHSRLSHAFPQRNWKDFIFSQQIPYQDLHEGKSEELFGEGEHIQLAACQNDESAYEVNGEGVFTKNLLDILQRCKGNISYHRLQSTIKNYLRHQFSQTPKIYSVGKDEGLFSCFLNKEFKESPLTGVVSYNKESGWILDMGSMQGIVSGAELSLTEDHSGDLYLAKVEKVHVTYSVIAFISKKEAPLDKNAIFSTQIRDFLTYALQIYVNTTTGASLKPRILETKGLSIVNEVTAADYCITEKQGFLMLSRPENPNTPIVPPISLDKAENEFEDLVLNYLSHLAQFNFVKNMSNADAFLLQPDAISLEILKGEDSANFTAVNTDELVLNYKKSGSQWSGSIRIKLRNKSDRKLYCAICYLSFNFGVVTKVLPTGVEGLDPGAEVWAMDGAPIRLVLEPEITKFDYKESISYLKLLISTEDFTQQLNTLTLEELPSPLSAVRVQRGLRIPKETEIIHDWTSRLITLRMPNPEKQS